MKQNQNSKQYDLEDRTFEFAKGVRDYLKTVTKTLSNIEYSKQLIRSSGSVAANYIEANESLSKKDFLLRIKICRKEAKETRLWLKLIDSESEIKYALLKEINELMKIFGAIVTKSS
jgi:four helix bundle protein